MKIKDMLALIGNCISVGQVRSHTAELWANYTIDKIPEWIYEKTLADIYTKAEDLVDPSQFNGYKGISVSKNKVSFQDGSSLRLG